MVFENTSVYPTPEGEQLKCPPPFSTYGFQKLATEYYAKGAYEQYKLPFTIIRPFNGVSDFRCLIYEAGLAFLRLSGLNREQRGSWQALYCRKVSLFRF